MRHAYHAVLVRGAEWHAGRLGRRLAGWARRQSGANATKETRSAQQHGEARSLCPNELGLPEEEDVRGYDPSHWKGLEGAGFRVLPKETMKLYGWILSFACCALGCGSGEGSSNVAGGNGGSTGGAVATTGGTGGTGARSSSGGTSGAGGSGGGSTQDGASGGTGGSMPSDAPSLLDPSLPMPSYDCRTDLITKECVSMSGTFGTTPIDLHCALANSPSVVFSSPPVWPTTCNDVTSSGTPSYTYAAYIPLQGPGTFHHIVEPGSDNSLGADVLVMLDLYGADALAENLIRIEIAGTVEQDPVTMHHIIYGTFRAEWGPPGEMCSAGTPVYCSAANVHGTFRVEHYLEP